MGFGTGTGRGTGSGGGTGGGKGWGTDRMACPALPLPAAIICCVINFILPGIGTMLAGCMNCCCGLNDGLEKSEIFGACCASFGIGLAQLVLTPFGLIGWIWSCVWGVFMIGQSIDYKNKIEQNPNDTNTNIYGGAYGVGPTNVVHYGGCPNGLNQPYSIPPAGSYPTQPVYSTVVAGQPYAPPPAAPSNEMPPPSYTQAVDSTTSPSAPCPPPAVSISQNPKEAPPSYQP